MISLSPAASSQPRSSFLPTSAPHPTGTLHVWVVVGEDHQEEEDSGDPSSPYS